MKNLSIALSILLSVLFLSPNMAKAEGNTLPESNGGPIKNESAEASAIIARLNEIKGMDISKLKSEEKQQLRKEVKSLKHQLKAVSGGVYLSAGALIIIILLLILLL
jgi:predicted PurR-regulated permease PerM